MSVSVGAVLIPVRADNTGLEGDLDKSKGILQGFGQQSGSMLAQQMNFAIGQFISTGLQSLTVGLKNAFNSVINSAKDSENATAQLRAVLKSTGGEAGMTEAAIVSLSSEMQHNTRFMDESVTAAASLLLTFTEIGKDVFPDALEATLNMSQALGQDLKSSAIQLGKALNDPIEGVTALRRVGVALTEQQESMIKGMMAMGNQAGAQRIVLEELRKEFGDSARAAGQTYAGALDRLKNAFDNVKETIGMAFIPTLQAMVGVLNSVVVPILQGFANVIGFIPTPITGLIVILGLLSTTLLGLAPQIMALLGLLNMMGITSVPALAAAITGRLIPALMSLYTSLVPLLGPLALVAAVVGAGVGIASLANAATQARMDMEWQAANHPQSITNNYNVSASYGSSGSRSVAQDVKLLQATTSGEMGETVRAFDYRSNTWLTQ